VDKVELFLRVLLRLVVLVDDPVSHFRAGLSVDAEGHDPEVVPHGPRRTAAVADVYELPPGQAISPYHYENPEEEWLIVLDGRPTLRHPKGEDELQPWDVVFFPPGPDGAHAVRNDTDSTARVLMFSNTSTVASSVYPDSNKIAIWTGNDADDIIVKRTSGVGYWDGESSRR
jgi:uncharacterized cupin superfamily protein